MNRREASLILELPYVHRLNINANPIWKLIYMRLQGTYPEQGQGAQEAPSAHATQPPRPRWQPVLGHQDQRGQGVPRQAYIIYPRLEPT